MREKPDHFQLILGDSGFSVFKGSPMDSLDLIKQDIVKIRELIPKTLRTGGGDEPLSILCI